MFGGRERERRSSCDVVSFLYDSPKLRPYIHRQALLAQGTQQEVVKYITTSVKREDERSIMSRFHKVWSSGQMILKLV